MKTRKILRTLKNHREKNERTCQCTHVQNHAYANKGRRWYLRDVHQLSNPAGTIMANIFKYFKYSSKDM